MIPCETFRGTQTNPNRMFSPMRRFFTTVRAVPSPVKPIDGTRNSFFSKKLAHLTDEQILSTTHRKYSMAGFLNYVNKTKLITESEIGTKLATKLWRQKNGEFNYRTYINNCVKYGVPMAFAFGAYETVKGANQTEFEMNRAFSIFATKTTENIVTIFIHSTIYGPRVCYPLLMSVFAYGFYQDSETMTNAIKKGVSKK